MAFLGSEILSVPAGGAAQHRAHPRQGRGVTKRGYPDIPCVPPHGKQLISIIHTTLSPKDPGRRILIPGPLRALGRGLRGRAGGAPLPQLGSDQTSRGCGAAAPSASRPLLALGRPRGAPGWRQPRQLCHVKSAAPIERVPSPGSNPITSAAVASLSAGRSSPRPGRFTPLAGPGSRGASIMRLMGC